jgi:hypothetical protein
MKEFNFSTIKSLIDRLEILNEEHKEVMSIEELQHTENQIGHKLPSEYKYFCQHLGSGRASGFIDFYCPTEKAILEQMQTLKYAKERIMDEMQKPMNSHTDRDVGEWTFLEKINLLNSSLLFGMFNSEAALLWDLRSSRASDDSYDIYWYNFDTPEYDLPIKIERNFTEFLSEFCYGQLACSKIHGFCTNEKPMKVEYNFYCLRLP